MKVYLIRHGETTANSEKRFAGVMDVSLTPKGELQAEQAGEKLKTVEFDAFYCSDLKRAMDSATIIGKYQTLKPTVLSELREMNFGIWEGKRMAEIKDQDSVLLDKWFKDFDNFVVPSGESVKEMFERVTKAYKKIIEPYNPDDDVKIAIVAHGGVIQALLSYLCYGDNTGYWRFRVDNCGINTIEYVMGYPVIRGLNQ